MFGLQSSFDLTGSQIRYGLGYECRLIDSDFVDYELNYYVHTD